MKMFDLNQVKRKPTKLENGISLFSTKCLIISK